MHGFTHAEEAAAAEVESDFFDDFGGVDAVVEVVGGDDFWEEVFGGFEVVVEAVDTGLFEAVGFFFGEEAEGGADFELGVFLFNLNDGFADGVDFVGGGGAGAGDEAVAFGFAFDGGLGAFEDGFDGLHVVAFDLVDGFGGLGAEGAVFGAYAAFDVAQEVEGDGVAEVLMPELIGGLKHVEQLVVGGFENGECFFWGGGLMVLNSVADLFPVHVFLRLLMVSNVEMWGGVVNGSCGKIEMRV